MALAKKAGSAVALGVAISGMHYTGMAAALFAPDSICTGVPIRIQPAWLGWSLGTFALTMEAALLLIAAYDAHVAKLTETHANGLSNLTVNLANKATELSSANAMLKQEVEERTRAESELREARATLEQRVAARTAELAQSNESLVEQMTKRQLADERIIESEARLQAFMQNSPSLMFIKDLQGCYVHVNEQFTRSFGMEQEDVLFRTDDEIFAPDQAAQFKANDTRALAAGKAIEAEEIARYADGLHTSIVCKFPLRDSTGKINGLGGIATDITARVEAERALRDSEAKLRAVIEDRERAARDLHDGIMQEIYAIGLGLEEAQRIAGHDPEAVKERIGIAIERLNKVLRDVRTHIVGDAPTRMSGMQLRDELDGLIESLRGLHPFQISLSIDPVALSYLSSATTHDVLNIVREAISNTLRHSRAQTARVSLRHDRGSVWLGIEDDGIGFRVEEALMRGKGLHNIAMRARQLGARIDVRSSPGQGTTITVEIPVRSPIHPRSGRNESDDRQNAVAAGIRDRRRRRFAFLTGISRSCTRCRGQDQQRDRHGTRSQRQNGQELPQQHLPEATCHATLGSGGNLLETLALAGDISGHASRALRSKSSAMRTRSASESACIFSMIRARWISTVR